MLKNFIHATFVAPQTRPYQTDNLYAALERQNEYDKEVAKLENKTAVKAGKKPASGKTAIQAGKGRVQKEPAEKVKEVKTDRTAAKSWQTGLFSCIM